MIDELHDVMRIYNGTKYTKEYVLEGASRVV